MGRARRRDAGILGAIANQFLGLSTKDYGLWYQVGLAVRQGLDIYPRPESGRLFRTMYPPSAAAMLAGVSLLGSVGSLLVLLLMNSAAWVVCIWLAVWLALVLEHDDILWL